MQIPQKTNALKYRTRGEPRGLISANGEKSIMEDVGNEASRLYRSTICDLERGKNIEYQSTICD